MCPVCTYPADDLYKEDTKPFIRCNHCQDQWHFKCLNLEVRPKTKHWFCPKCWTDASQAKLKHPKPVVTPEMIREQEEVHCRHAERMEYAFDLKDWPIAEGSVNVRHHHIGMFMKTPPMVTVGQDEFVIRGTLGRMYLYLKKGQGMPRRQAGGNRVGKGLMYSWAVGCALPGAVIPGSTVVIDWSNGNYNDRHKMSVIAHRTCKSLSKLIPRGVCNIIYFDDHSSIHRAWPLGAARADELRMHAGSKSVPFMDDTEWRPIGSGDDIQPKKQSFYKPNGDMKGTEDLLKEREGFKTLRAVKNAYKTHTLQVQRLLEYDDFKQGQETSLVASICALYGILHRNTPKYYPNMAFIEFLIRCLKAWVRGHNPQLTSTCAKMAVGSFLKECLPKLIQNGNVWNCVRHVGQNMRDKLEEIVKGIEDNSSTRSHRTASAAVAKALFQLPEDTEDALIDVLFEGDDDDSDGEFEQDDDNGGFDSIDD